MSEAPATAHPPVPPSERRAWLLACSVGLLGAVVFLSVLLGLVGRSATISPPPLPVVAGVPSRPSSPASSAPATFVAHPSAEQQRLQAARLREGPRIPIATRWMEGFYPIYATGQSTFAVNWLLLASIHSQESAFSTAPGTYHGLNFAHCCGGPMQFNVTNGRVSTWDLVSNSYRYGRRPAVYGHMTAVHPSIYDDFDAIMAAAHLLSADGAGYALDDSAWRAAYDYYGHDATGVLYADEVLARAIGWSQHGFCANCGVGPTLLDAVDAAYGAPVRASLAAPSRRAPARAVSARRPR